MRRNRLGAVTPVLAGCLLAWSNTPAAAQTPETDADLERAAQALIRDGAVDYAAGNYADALAKFERAYGIYATPEALLNSSRAENRLGRCDRAWTYAQRYVKTVPEGGLALARDELSHLEMDCPEITVTSKPPGASVWIDVEAGEPAGTTPWTGRVAVGRRSIIARLPGSPDVRMAVNVVPGPPPAFEVSFGASGAMPTPATRPTAPPPPMVLAAPEMARPATVKEPANEEPRPTFVQPVPTLRKVGFGATAAGGLSLLTAVILGVNVHNMTAGLSATPRPGAEAQQVITTTQSRATAANALYFLGALATAAGVGLVIVY